MIRLRPPDFDDAPRLFAAVHESLADLQPWMEWASEKYGVVDASKWIGKTQTKRTEGSAHEFFIVNEADALVGTCGVNRSIR